MTKMRDEGTRGESSPVSSWSNAAMKMCRRYGSTGTSTPASRPICRAYGPAACVDARRRGEEEQVAVLMQVDRLADLVREPLEQPDRFNREADVRFVGE